MQGKSGMLKLSSRENRLPHALPSQIGKRQGQDGSTYRLHRQWIIRIIRAMSRTGRTQHDSGSVLAAGHRARPANGSARPQQYPQSNEPRPPSWIQRRNTADQTRKVAPVQRAAARDGYLATQRIALQQTMSTGSRSDPQQTKQQIKTPPDKANQKPARSHSQSLFPPEAYRNERRIVKAAAKTVQRLFSLGHVSRIMRVLPIASLPS